MSLSQADYTGLQKPTAIMRGKQPHDFFMGKVKRSGWMEDVSESGTF